MNESAASDEVTTVDNPYATDSTWTEQPPSGPHRTAASIAVGALSGIFTGLLASMLCWIILRVSGSPDRLPPLQAIPLPLSVILPGLCGLATAWLIGSRVQRRISRRFQRVNDAELRRASMTEQMADLRGQLKDHKRRRPHVDS